MILHFYFVSLFLISNLLINYYDFFKDIIMYIIIRINSFYFNSLHYLNKWDLHRSWFLSFDPLIFKSIKLTLLFTNLPGEDKFSILIYVLLFTSYLYLDIDIFFLDYIEFILFGLYYFYFFVMNVFIYYLNPLLSI